MKNLFLVAIILSLFVFKSEAQTTMKIRGKNFAVDTLFHAKIGPGTTQTSIKLTGLENNDKFRIFYLTTDRSNPYISFAAACACDKVAGFETVRSMAERSSTNDKCYFAGVNGGFYRNGTAANGQSMNGTPTSTCVVDGEVYTGYSHVEYQFAFDRKFEPFLQNMRFNKSTVTCNGNKAFFKAVNINIPNQGTSDIGGVTLFTPKFYGCTNQTDQKGLGYQVIARLVKGDIYSVYAPYRMEIISTPVDMGNVDIPENCYVLHGHGAKVEEGTNVSGIDFVKSLNIGDTVTFTHNITMKETPIVPSHVVSGHPWVVYQGKTWENSINEGGYGNERHPRTCLGYTKNKEKVIMMVVDGRSAISNGAKANELGDIMVYAGAVEAVNIDGGGSACLHTKALGTRNVPSDGKERAISHALYVVSNTPEDNNIASIDFMDYVINLPQYGQYSPVIYGYNKYGMLIDTDFSDFTLSCPEEFGRIINGKTLAVSGTAKGSFALTASYKGINVKLPVVIIDGTSEITPRYQSIIFDGIRDYKIEVQTEANGKIIPISPTNLVWRSSDETILKIGANTGKLEAVADGNAIVEGTLGDKRVSVNVAVQIPKADKMPIDNNFDPNTWKISASGAKVSKLESCLNGMNIDFSGVSGRVHKIQLSKEIPLWSLPDGIRMKINPGDTDIKNILVLIKTANGENRYVNFDATLKQNSDNDLVIDLSKEFNTEDFGTYPMSIGAISIAFNKVEANKAYHISIPNFETVYNGLASVGNILVDNEKSLNIYPNPVGHEGILTVNGIENGYTEFRVLAINRAVLLKENMDVVNNNCRIQLRNLEPGTYVLQAKIADKVVSSAFIVK